MTYTWEEYPENEELDENKMLYDTGVLIGQLWISKEQADEIIRILNESQYYREQNEPLSGYKYWDEHPGYPRADWKYEVRNDDTSKGYWSWVQTQIELQEEDDACGRA